ncbi:uncharacterized protein LOC121858778 [Homarus americanus]|uniref:uncharacterized protein LOC121858778 n=1 Tax=Homarus americanus TaxID=6706 RepID=UPI001C43EEEF|nr:uncharacterized protein LOC121858778 [Homarus americanus]
MEILTLAGARPPHEDVPMDLTTSSRRQLVLHHSSWSHLREDSKHRMETVLQPITKLPADAMMVRSSQTSASRYIPHQRKDIVTRFLPRPSSANSPPSSTAWDVSCLFTSEVGCKRARLESPKPSDLVCDLDVRPPSAEDKNTTTTTVITSSSSGGSDKRQGLGAGPARGNGDVVEAGEGVSQSVMRPRQRQRSPHAGTSSVGSPAGIGTSDSDIVPGSCSTHRLPAATDLDRRPRSASSGRSQGH